VILPTSATEFAARLQCLRSYAILSGTEAELQDALARVLTAEDIVFEREKILSPENRVDFYLPTWRCALEVKIAGSPTEVLRQLQRYAAVPTVDRLALVTRRVRLVSLPHDVGGKPLTVFALWRGAL
jgi:hypothetical protein